MGNNQLSLVQEFVGYAHTFIEQAAGILAQVEDQALQIAHLIERVGDFFFRGLVEAGDVHIADAGPDQEVQIDAVARNFVAHHGELQRLVRAFAQNGDVDGGAFGSLEQVGYVAGAHVVGGLAIDGDDDVARDEFRRDRRVFPQRAQ